MQLHEEDPGGVPVAPLFLFFSQALGAKAILSIICTPKYPKYSH
jgi:hypothetical protein